MYALWCRAAGGCQNDIIANEKITPIVLYDTWRVLIGHSERPFLIVGGDGGNKEVCRFNSNEAEITLAPREEYDIQRKLLDCEIG